MFGRFKQKFTFLFLVLIIFGSFGLGIWFGKTQTVCQICPPEKVDFSLFWQAWEKIQEKYVDKGNLNVQDMIYGAVAGMVNSLGDPYTVFMEPEDAKVFTEDVKGSFEGVGMEIGSRDNKLKVIAPLEGSPAKEAGLMAGDEIVEIDGTSTAGIYVMDAVKMIRGTKGTEVSLGIMREGWQEMKIFKIVRKTIEIPSLNLEIRDDNIAYLQLYQFSEKASYDFQKAAIRILESPAEKIVLDLRNNPGGYLEVAQDIAGWFLEKGQTVAIEDFGEGREDQYYKAQGNSQLNSYQVVVLINEGSASASEILAGALRDNQEVKLIGETSFGKGTVQEMEKLKGGSSIKITVAKWLTPNGDLITSKGLDPDIKVELSAEDYEEGRDPQLERALEFLKSL
ncbi:MAG: S41 family peptidase [Candidatus Pacebacteria bacterium]|nr:S41 family peptidase [Candidatus Paceibacterota bacterium]